MAGTSRQALEEDLFEARQTLDAIVDVLGDDTLSPTAKIREIRDVLTAEFDALEDEELEEG